MKLMTKLITVAVFACCLAACQGEKGESNSQTAQSQNADQLQTKFTLKSLVSIQRPKPQAHLLRILI